MANSRTQIKNAFVFALSQQLDRTGSNVKAAVDAVVASNRSLSTFIATLPNTQPPPVYSESIDGWTITAGDRLLLVGQSAALENGIYSGTVVGFPSNPQIDPDGIDYYFTLFRTSDANTGAELSGMEVWTPYGSTYGGSGWRLTTAGTIVQGVTPLTFEQITASVRKGRFNVTDGADLPLVYVWMAREETDTQTLTVSRFQMRTMSLVADYWMQAATTGALEDGMDEASETIRTAALADSTLSGTCEDILLTSTEYLYEGDEAQPFGCARLTFTVKYFSTEP